jgi:hypothetical protein
MQWHIECDNVEKINPRKTTERELGTVSSRVVLLLRSAEVKPLFYRFVPKRNIILSATILVGIYFKLNTTCFLFISLI